MPLIGEFHTLYWEFSDTNVAPVHLGRGGYPLWQASVISPSLFGSFQLAWDAIVEAIRWFRASFRRTYRLDPATRALLLHVVDTLEHPAYPAAQRAVRQTAQTLGFNRPEAWKDLSRQTKDDPGRAENVYRHLKAMQILRQEGVSTLANPTQNLLVELAYHDFAIRGR